MTEEKLTEEKITEEKITEEKITKKSWLYWSIYAVMTICVIFTRLWQLDRLPMGLHVDEASMSYTAWCLAHYGVDRYLKSWPVYLMNFSGGQSAMYTYLCVLFFKIFGFSIWTIRLPAVLFSLLTFIFGVKIAQRIKQEGHFFAVCVGLLITVGPYFIMAGRFGLDCNLMLGMSTVFLYGIVRALQEGRWQDYLLAGLAGGLTLYTYALSYIAVPLFLLLLFIYVLWIKKFSWKNWIAMAVPMAVLAFPLILVQLVNALDWPELRIGIFTITKMETYRASEFTPMKFVYLRQALNCLFGGDGFLYNMAPGYSALYGISEYLFYIGLIGAIYDLVCSIRKRQFSGLTIVLFWFASILFLECHLIANINKLNGIFFAYAILVTEGIRILYRICNQKVVARCIMGIFMCAYIGLFLDFARYYYGGEYAEKTTAMQYFGYDISSAIDFLEEHPELQNRMTRIGGNSVFYAASVLQSPYELGLYRKENLFHGKFVCSNIEEIEPGYNYILWGEDMEYAEELRQEGYSELLFEGYALYYR